MHLGFVGQQLGQGATEPDRLGGQLRAAAVALVEDQVDDRQRRSQAIGQQVRRRHSERDARRGDLVLGPDQALGHRRLRHEERAGDLGGAEPAQGAQRQSHLGVERQRRMAAGEHELEPLVGDRRLVHDVLHGLGLVEQGQLRGERAIPANAVDRAVARGRQQPRPRLRGRSLARPALGRDREGVLRGLLGELEVAEEADQAREHAAPLVVEGLLEDRYDPFSGRTSTAPPSRAAGMRAASSIAASRSSAS